MLRQARQVAGMTTLIWVALCGSTTAWAVESGEKPIVSAKEKQVRKPLPDAAAIAALPENGGAEFNRLIFSASPYLLQHARNPVDWRPWGDEAFAAAKALDKPVFLSIGYATCHWCHVMEHESFEDESVAALMNEAFVCVKVDREERPDVDQVYMTVTQMLTGSGGWPMTVLLTPDRRPFFAGTYFPKTGRSGRPGMMELVPALSKAWREDREQVVEAATRVTAALTERNRAGGGGLMPDADALNAAYVELAERFDRERGGFGSAPKFPTPHQLNFLLRQELRRNDGRALAMVEKTLQAMRRGGICDQIGGGYHRYSTDPDWLVPHFEKMLYDQALIALAALDAWQLTSDPQYADTAREIFAYVSRDLSHPQGGFFSAEDADSEGEEGKFYVWTTAELEAALPAEDAALFATVYGFRAEGNFRDEATGRLTGANIPHLPRPLSEVAAAQKMTVAELTTRLATMRSRLFAIRKQRVHPFKDDKVLTDWNGLMIAAYARGGKTLHEPALTARAVAAATFVWDHLRTPGNRLHKRWRNGQAGLHGLLEDYAFVVWGFIELYEATQDPQWLERAVSLHTTMRQRFADSARGGFFQTPDDGETLLVRPREIYDGALPSGNSVAAYNGFRLSRYTGDTAFAADAEGVLRAFSGQLGQLPSAHAQTLAAVDFMVGPSHEVVVSAADAESGRAVLAALQSPYLPRTTIMLRTPQTAPLLDTLAPYTRTMKPPAKGVDIYVCKDFACELPTADIAKALKSLGIPRSRR